MYMSRNIKTYRCKNCRTIIQDIQKNKWYCSKVCKREFLDRKKEEATRETLGRVYSTPGKYKNQFQKDVVFNSLQQMGWQYNEEKKIWWKLPIKDEEGKWLNIDEEKTKKTKKTRNRLSKEEQQIFYLKVKKMRDEDKMKFKDIAKELNISKPKINYYYYRYEEEN